MGIYLPNMEMPKNCFECPWRCKVDPENLLCRISGEYFDETFSGTIQNRHKSCPLAPVPPHGRLIDADALYSHIKDEQRKCNDPHDGWSECQVALGFVNTAPTIIPAEEGET
jgi:hypothetical protein